MLEQQVRRMLKHPKAEALAVNFAGQWLNLRGLDATAPLPLIYPDFDDPLRQAMRREVELLFDTIVREDRSVVELLTADYTFVNERLAKHYGIKNIYGSQFRRVTLGPGMEARQGLLGKGAFLATTSKPERTSPVTRGKWIMTNILGMRPPAPPADVPPLPPRAGDPNAKEPTMRQKMLDHRVRQDCVQCHRLMDPIGFSLENFDGIGLWRTHGRGHAGRSEGAAVRQHADRRPAAAAQLAGDEVRRPVRHGGHREAADLRARPRRRVSRHAARPRDRARRRQEQRPLLGARARRRQEPAVPDEHEGARRPTSTASAAHDARTTGEPTDHVVHHQEAHPPPDVPARAPASRWPCRCSTRCCRRARRWRRPRPDSAEPRFVGIFFPHGMAPGYWEPAAEGALPEKLPYILESLDKLRTRPSC